MQNINSNRGGERKQAWVENSVKPSQKTITKSKKDAKPEEETEEEKEIKEIFKKFTEKDVTKFKIDLYPGATK